MATVITAPESWEGQQDPAIFLAGGITDCPNWQTRMVYQLSDLDAVLLNPRRPNFPIDDPRAAEVQITWEHHALRRADVILFWFCKETLNPIVLYELGAWSMAHKPIFVGIEPGYERERDVRIQTRLARPDLPQPVRSERELAMQVREYVIVSGGHWSKEPT